MTAVRPTEEAVGASLHLGAGPAHHAVADPVVHGLCAREVFGIHVHGVHIAFFQQLRHLFLLEFLHHGSVAGITTRAHDDALSRLEQCAGAVLGCGDDASYAPGLVLHEHLGLGIVANVGAVVGQIGVHA